MAIGVAAAADMNNGPPSPLSPFSTFPPFPLFLLPLPLFPPLSSSSSWVVGSGMFFLRELPRDTLYPPKPYPFLPDYGGVEGTLC